MASDQRDYGALLLLEQHHVYKQLDCHVSIDYDSYGWVHKVCTEAGDDANRKSLEALLDACHVAQSEICALWLHPLPELEEIACRLKFKEAAAQAEQELVDFMAELFESWKLPCKVVRAYRYRDEKWHLLHQ